MINDVTGVLLAGGKSRRMGEDKRFVTVGDKSLFERSLTVLQTVFEKVCVVVAQDTVSVPADVLVLRDLISDCGSLGGIFTGLSLASTPHVFVTACDMPFLDPDAIRYVVESRFGMDIVMPRIFDELQPMHALYGGKCLPAMNKMMQARDLKIHRLISDSSLRVRIIAAKEFSNMDDARRSFLNVNTPMDLQSARTIEPSRGPARE
nr:molybdenum cofactor guanylyltransferase [Nitrospira sp. KM1]